MIPSEPANWKPFDARVSLATTMESQRGVYALLLGSGTSTAVGIPTGWGVVEVLVRRVAAASGSPISSDADWEEWWTLHAAGKPLGYSSLIEDLALTAAARRALLSGFFEPSPEDRASDLKVPGEAHRAIAKLVSRGSIRVIVTTNFDRLIEQALEAEGVMPQVISSEAGAKGMEPLQHAGATVIKLHGDYASLDQRNTVSELSSYSPATLDLLTHVLDEYGLIVSGWSGEWDTALVAAIESTSNRRYPLHWTSRSEIGTVSKRLTARSGAQVIGGVTAEEFFPDLLSRVEAVETLAEAPASLAIKIARLRRALPDPVRHLELRAIFSAELAALQNWLAERPRNATENSYGAMDKELDHVFGLAQPLIQLYAEGILLDRDRQHTELWVWVLQEALNARSSPNGAFTPWWENFAHYPAFLLLRAGTMAALVAKHEDVIVRISGDPMWSSILVEQGVEVPAHEVLHISRVLDEQAIKQLPRWDGTSYRYPSSHLVRSQLLDTALRLAGRNGAEKLLDRMEYRNALASSLLRSGNVYYHGAASGDYLGGWPWRENDGDSTSMTTDFLERGDHGAWGRTGESDADFTSQINQLDERLRAIRRD